MLNKEKILSKIILLILLLTNAVCLHANFLMPGGGTLTQAIALFEAGNYKEALPILKDIIEEEPGNKMVNYYYGASMVEEGIYNEATNKALLTALSGNTPDKVLYYIGRYFHHKNLWNSALKYYNLFKNSASETEKNELHLQELIDFCYNKINNGAPAATDSLHLNIQDSTGPGTTKTNGLKAAETTSAPEHITKPIVAQPEEIHFQINSLISYLRINQFKTDSAKQLFEQGQATDKELNDLLKKADSLRAEYKNSLNRDNISKKIIEAEKESLLLESKRDKLFSDARELENIYWDKASTEEKEALMHETEMLGNAVKKEKQEKVEINNEIIDTLAVVAPEIFFNEQEEEVTKTENQDDNKIIYKIQIGAYSRELPAYIDRLFKKLSFIRKIDKYVDEKGIVVYTTGNLTNFEDALQMQTQVRQEGVKDAFVVAYNNGKRITLKEAKKLTKGQ